MFRVIVVDDERDICEGLQYLIDWERYGFELVGLAYDGKSALHLIEEKQPDLIVTDIRMPEIDGLELISELENRNLECYVIILSGFADFSYVQHAIKLGANAYLLKPIDEFKLIEEVDRAREFLYKRQNIRRAEQKKNAILQNLFLQRILFDGMEQAVWRQGIKYIGLRNSKTAYRIVVAEYLQNQNRPELFCNENSEEDPLQLIEKLREYVSFSEQIIIFQINKEQFGILLELPLFLEGQKNDVFELRQRIRNFFIENFQEQIVFGISGIKSSLEDFKDACNEALADILLISKTETTAMLEPPSNNKATEILEYINSHFAENLHLQDLADQVFHFHAVYLGRMIKKYTGLSFNKYLNTLRIQRAIKLLQSTKLSITDISQNVGYQYIDHFYKNFRELTGMTPGEYIKKYKEHRSIGESTKAVEENR